MAEHATSLLEAQALEFDARDPLAAFRDEFLIPRNDDGS